jgi:hypothetical protein
MPCDLSDMELQILSILYRNTCFNSSASYHSKKLKKILRSKYDDDIDTAFSHLQNMAYITAVRKQDPKFYISDIGKVYLALKAHGKNVTAPGRSTTHHLD